MAKTAISQCAPSTSLSHTSDLEDRHLEDIEEDVLFSEVECSCKALIKPPLPPLCNQHQNMTYLNTQCKTSSTKANLPELLVFSTQQKPKLVNTSASTIIIDSSCPCLRINNSSTQSFICNSTYTNNISPYSSPFVDSSYPL
jgi:hypothetical protein